MVVKDKAHSLLCFARGKPDHSVSRHSSLASPNLSSKLSWCCVGGGCMYVCVWGKLAIVVACLRWCNVTSPSSSSSISSSSPSFNRSHRDMIAPCYVSCALRYINSVHPRTLLGTLGTCLFSTSLPTPLNARHASCHATGLERSNGQRMSALVVFELHQSTASEAECERVSGTCV